MSDMQLCGYELDLLAEIRQRGQVVSLFNLSQRVLALDYGWARECLYRLESRRLIDIKKNGAGRPLVITARRTRRSTR